MNLVAAILLSATGIFSPPTYAYAGTAYSNHVPVSSHMAMLASGSDPTGVCGSGTGGCWRDTGPVDFWPRDIAGDTHQQFDVTYWGQAPGADNGACSQFSNIGVFTFTSPADGFKFVGAAFFSGGKYYVGDQVANNVFSNWAWDPNGFLYNCGDTAAQGVTFSLQHGGNYSQLWTQNLRTSPGWQQIHV